MYSAIKGGSLFGEVYSSTLLVYICVALGLNWCYCTAVKQDGIAAAMKVWLKNMRVFAVVLYVSCARNSRQFPE